MQDKFKYTGAIPKVFTKVIKGPKVNTRTGETDPNPTVPLGLPGTIAVKPKMLFKDKFLPPEIQEQRSKQGRGKGRGKLNGCEASEFPNAVVLQDLEGPTDVGEQAPGYLIPGGTMTQGSRWPPNNKQG